MVADTISQMLAHLEFLGYEISHSDDLLMAKHPKKMNVILRNYKGGVLFTAMNGSKDAAKRDRLGFLSLMNLFNSKAAVARFYHDKDYDLFIEAWYPDCYDRAKFGAFMEAWENDSLTMLLSCGDDVLKFLK